MSLTYPLPPGITICCTGKHFNGNTHVHPGYPAPKITVNDLISTKIKQKCNPFSSFDIGGAGYLTMQELVISQPFNAGINLF